MGLGRNVGLMMGTVVALAACAESQPSSTSMPNPDPSHQAPSDPAAYYQSACANCHGGMAEGGVAPALDRYTKTRDELIKTIDESMPLADAILCTGDCAKAMADFVLDVLQKEDEQPPMCADAPRGLRLLTRAEYRNTVRDLFRPSPRNCSQLADCDFEQESCALGECRADACTLHTFSLELNGSASSVVVAGTFNDWGSSVESGAIAMGPLPGTNTWLAKQEFPESRIEYKFVIDGTDWISDPNNPDGVPDGYGGENSVVTIVCGDESGEFDFSDLTATFPPEVRPGAFPFDNNRDSGLVTTNHVTEYMKAGLRVAEQIGDRAVSALGCDVGSSDCRNRFLRTFGRSAFRRPLSTEEIGRYTRVWDEAATPEEGLAVVLRVILSSPNFLYRSELGEMQPDGRVRLTQYEVASALSYLILRTSPDQELLDAAEQEALGTRDQRQAQALRLLAKPEARETIGEMGLMWLGAEKIMTVDKHPATFPQATPELRAKMKSETKLLLAHVALDGGSLRDLYLADYTFVDAALGSLYGIAANGAEGPTRVSYGQTGRSGILGHASILGTYAHSQDSSPILRGVFIRERLLCDEFGAPPPDAGGIPSVDPNATTRERYRQHTDNDACSACHKFIDEVGFGFEHFDALGRHRSEENGMRIDHSGLVRDVEGFGTATETPFSDLSELAAIIASSARANRCFVKQYFRFAMGRTDSEADACALDALYQEFEGNDFDIRSLMIALVRSEAFVLRGE